MPTCEHSNVCGRDALDGHDGKCVLHSEVPDKNRDAFEKALAEHRDEHGPDFRRMVFPAGTNLSDVDATQARFGGADLSGVTMPAANAEYDLLDQISQATAYARTLQFTILLFSAYCLLTIGTTTTGGLYSNGTTSQLPFLGTGMPLVEFYIIAPLGLLVLYIYFHIQLQRVWGKIAALPAVFPDGKPLDLQTDPWLVVGFVRPHLTQVSDTSRPFSVLQYYIVLFVSWGIVPIALVFFAIRYMPKQDPIGTLWHLVLCLVSVWMAYSFLWSAKAVLRGDVASSRSPTEIWRPRSVLRSIAAAFILGAGLWVFPNALVTHFFPSPDFSDADLESVDFSDENLQGANFLSANLRDANLSDADLENADLEAADLRQANLRNANLSSANLYRARLDSSNLVGADLRDAYLIDARMSSTRMYYTRADGSIMSGADFSRAIVLKTDFTDADLSYTTWIDAAVSSPTFDSVDLKAANFEGAFLDGDFPGANLQFADLRNLKMEVSTQRKTSIEFTLARPDTKKSGSTDSKRDPRPPIKHFFEIPLSNTEFMHKGYCKVKEDGLRGVKFGQKNRSRISDSLLTNICADSECSKKLGHLGTYPENDPRRCKPQIRPPNVEE